ncbi:sensor histidine kinase [Qaidamihabitans albus]|uniref:sensor histidine kinase n=1 Tax=Qaidamihabitans albus TaxID=2795733 RepID=UPI0018F163E5|nr:histidine kinase [Qaidamihabitans albus]
MGGIPVPLVHEAPARRRPSRAVIDGVLVAVLTTVVVFSLPFVAEGDGTDRPLPVGFGLVLAAAAATAVRGRHPAVAALIAVAATSTYLALSYPYSPVFAFVLLTVYTLARRLPLLRSALLALVCLVMLSAHVLSNDAALSGAIGLLPATAWIAIPFTVGAARRMVVAAAARERAATDRQLVDAERLRLSQEVHDVVGHGLAAIQMQADIALHVAQQRPGQMREALAAISTASGQALTELRETLRSTHPDGEAKATRAPTPGLARVRELCDRVADVGVEVDLTISGEQRPLIEAVDVAAYRVLQEALTNVVKHSPHPRAEVRINHTADSVTVEVTNQNLAPAPPAPGIGISGMQRRTAAVGGTFSAGQGTRPATFTVCATFPRSQETP